MENLEGEIWKDVVGCEGFYMISNMARVKSTYKKSANKITIKVLYKDSVVKQYLSTWGYPIVNLSTDVMRGQKSVHRMMAIAFIPNPDNKPCVNHINGIKTDNRIENLEWVTYKENTKHAIRIGLCKIGQDRTQSKLTDEKVLAIKRLFRLNPSTNKRAISRKLNLSQNAISNIYHGKSWTHINIS